MGIFGLIDLIVYGLSFIVFHVHHSLLIGKFHLLIVIESQQTKNDKR